MEMGFIPILTAENMKANGSMVKGMDKGHIPILTVQDMRVNGRGVNPMVMGFSPARTRNMLENSRMVRETDEGF